MERNEFDTLVKKACETPDLPTALNYLKNCCDPEIANAASALTGQFSLAEIEGNTRIYHVFTEENDQGEPEEFIEHVMDLDDEVIVFVAWFFFTQFDIKQREIYAAVGKTYKQPKRG